MLRFDKRNAFDLTHERKFSCDMGYLVPFLCEDMVPGDKWYVKTDLVLRLTPLLAPIMHRVDVFTHFFFVPTRLLWKDWENFITGGKYGNDSPNADGSNPYVKPYVTLTSPTSKALSTYFGLPCVQNYPDQTTYDPGTFTVDAMPFRAMAKIWNDWYRDENLQDEIEFSTDGGQDSTIETATLYSRNWEKDYFTSALPWQQRGPASYLPLGVEAPVYGNDNSIMLIDRKTPASSNTKALGYWTTGSYGLRTVGDNNTQYGLNPNNTYEANDMPIGHVLGLINKNFAQAKNVNSGLVTDLSMASAVSVSQVRTAFQVQKFLEKSARAGYRYIEYILEHFGVHSPDARLQRSEFLGGGRSPVIVSEVLQTSSTDTTTPQGNMAGHGINVNANHAFTKSFTETGYIIGIMSILPRTSYQQGINRMWLRETKYDYLVPVLSHLSMQGVYEAELCQTGSATDKTIFGYQNRYDELRRRESHVAGDLVDNMNFWHMGRIFDTTPATQGGDPVLPVLNGDFVKADPTKRIFAVTDESEDACIVDLLVNAKAIRPLPKHGNPGLIDHSQKGNNMSKNFNKFTGEVMPFRTQFQKSDYSDNEVIEGESLTDTSDYEDINTNFVSIIDFNRFGYHHSSVCFRT